MYSITLIIKWHFQQYETQVFVPYPIKVDDHGPVAHFRRFVVGVSDGREGNFGAAGAHRDAQRGARRVRRRVGVAHHQALPLQDDRFRLVLSAARVGACREPHGTQQAKRQHTHNHKRRLGLLVHFETSNTAARVSPALAQSEANSAGSWRTRLFWKLSWRQALSSSPFFLKFHQVQLDLTLEIRRPFFLFIFPFFNSLRLFSDLEDSRRVCRAARRGRGVCTRKKQS